MPQSVATRIMQRLRRSTPGLVLVSPSSPRLPPPGDTTERAPRGNFSKAGSAAGLLGPVRDNRDRLEAYRDFRIIDSEIPEGGASLDAITAVATTGEPGNEIRVFDADVMPDAEGVDAAQADDVIDALVDRLGLRELVPKALRATLKIGDAALHVIVDRAGTIVRTRPLAPDLLHPVRDEFGRQVGWVYRGYEGAESFLFDWEVIHLPFLPELGHVFGRSLFWSGGRGTAFRLMSMRDSATFQAVNNASGRNAFIFGLPIEWGPGERLAWRNRMHDDLYRRRVIDSNGRLDRRAISALDEEHLVLDYAVGVDGKGVEPKVVPLAEAPLEAQVSMLEHFQDLFLAVCKVPKPYLNIERSGDGLGSERSANQETQFLRLCNHVQHMGAWLVLTLIEKQFRLIGKPLPAGTVKLTLPDLSPKDEKVRGELRKLNAEAAQVVLDSGFPASYAWVEYLYDGEREAAEEGARLYGFPLEAGEPGGDAQLPEAAATRLRALGRDAAVVRKMLSEHVGRGNVRHNGADRPDALL